MILISTTIRKDRGNQTEREGKKPNKQGDDAWNDRRMKERQKYQEMKTAKRKAERKENDTQKTKKEKGWE
jgi:hypothetical protein